MASRLGLPLGDDGALATADDPEAAYDALIGVEADQDLVAVLHTSMGPLSCILYRRAAPVTVANFVGLARGTLPWIDPRSGGIGEGSLYAETTFHRVIPEFMIQGGDPLGDGTGGPGYRFPDEISAGLSFDRPGVLAMANSGPHTNGSQFFITEAPVSSLNGLHTIFGQCDQEAVAVVAEIARTQTRGDRPLEPVRLEQVEIRAVPKGPGGG
ncbi:MAG TPA: peptidylprolyl isomerase [Deltaproteobacteria bacterium]|nr:peptidylprolyl isomerase [Deltaproteobacteria bacterium]